MATSENKQQHMALWSQVEKTPTSAVKNTNRNGQTITAIDTYHMIRLATQAFGPMGIGWGYTIDEDRFDQGGPVFDPKGALQGHELIHTLRMTLWFKWQGERGEITQFGHTRAVYRTNKGTWMTDEDAAKKSTSDAMKKCLSLLGFAADVFTGKFDDVGYVAERRAETELEAADDFDAALAEKRDEFKAWLDKQCDGFRLIPHPASIQKALAVQIEQLQRRASIARLDDIATQKSAERLHGSADAAIKALLDARAAKQAAQLAAAEAQIQEA